MQLKEFYKNHLITSNKRHVLELLECNKIQFITLTVMISNYLEDFS